MAFENLSDKLNNVFKNLRGKGRLYIATPTKTVRKPRCRHKGGNDVLRAIPFLPKSAYVVCQIRPAESRIRGAGAKVVGTVAVLCGRNKRSVHVEFIASKRGGGNLHLCHIAFVCKGLGKGGYLWTAFCLRLPFSARRYECEPAFGTISGQDQQWIEHKRRRTCHYQSSFHSIASLGAT